MADELNHIGLKKPIYPVGEAFQGYLRHHSRSMELPLAYTDLLRWNGWMPQVDAHGRATLWHTVLLHPSEMEETHEKLVTIYQLLVADGRRADHLAVADISFCAFGNSQPFRIRILNTINDNHDHYYIKRTDASRVFGLELEDLLSPYRINFLVDGPTLVEEHIIGVPGDAFIADPRRYGGDLNPVRLSKEFVKFNERCFARLLGDMRAYNFVVDVIQDFDQVQYRLRSIDFDQQCYEGRHRIYLPQFYKENLPYVRFAERYITRDSVEQYRNEEQALLRRRVKVSRDRLGALLEVVRHQPLSAPEQVAQLADELATLHGDPAMRSVRGMGELLQQHLMRRLGSMAL